MSNKLIVVNKPVTFTTKPLKPFKRFSKSFKEDMRIGIMLERKCFGILKKYYPNVQFTPKGHRMDFFVPGAKSIYIELKGKCCEHDVFDLVMIPYSKLKYAEKVPESKILLLFYFKDGIRGVWRHMLRKNVNYYVKVHCRKARIDKVDKPEDYAYIIRTHLKPLDELIEH